MARFSCPEVARSVSPPGSSLFLAMENEDELLEGRRDTLA